MPANPPSLDSLFPNTHGVPEIALSAYHPEARPYTQSVGVAIPSNMAAPAGSQLASPESPGFPLPGARNVERPPMPAERGARDGRLAAWSAPVLSIDDDLDARVARQSPGGSATSDVAGSPVGTRRPTPPVPGPFGSARIPNGGGRGGGRS